MALNETSLRDVIMMEVARVNDAGGVLGRPVEPIALDPASDWAAYREMAQLMTTRYRVAAIFGCWTSASRKMVIPLMEQTDTLLYYALQYEGEEQSPNVFYLGATPNQQAIPALEYLMSAPGGAFSRFFFVGTDYIYPRTTNRFLRAFLKAKGIPLAYCPELYVPFGHNDWHTQMEALKRFRASGRGAIISTINGDSNLSFYKAVKNIGFTAEDLPIMAFSVSEAELQWLNPDDVAGHYACWDYFMSEPAPENHEFLTAWRRFDGQGRPVYAPMAAAGLGFRLWCKAVTAAGTTETGPVRQYMLGRMEMAMNGKTATMGVNHHIDMAMSIARARSDRKFQIVWTTPRSIFGDPWAADKLIADATTANAQRDVLDALPNPLIVLNEKAEICYRSISTCAYLGEAISATVLQRLHAIIRDWETAEADQISRRLPEITLHDASGCTRHMTVTVSRMVFAGQPAHLLSLGDVTYIREIEDQLRTLNRQLHELASTDPLTGVNNRRHFFNAVSLGLHQMQLHRLPAAMFLLDLDHFKAVNDSYGHELGDHALVQVAATACRILRKNDIFARIGGEEFAAFLPETDMAGAVQVAERLRHAVSEVQLSVANATIGLTCSIGVASVDAQTDTPGTAMNRADQALYAAKRQGRDQVRWH